MFARISHRNYVKYTLETTVFYVKRPQLSIETIKNAKKMALFEIIEFESLLAFSEVKMENSGKLDLTIGKLSKFPIEITGWLFFPGSFRYF